MGKINSRAKGKNGELEWARFCRERGYAKSRRTAQHCGNTGDASDVVGLPGIHQEVKRVEAFRLYDAMEQAKHDSQKSGKLPVVFHRRNHCEWVAIMRADDWFKLYREWELSLDDAIKEKEGVMDGDE